MDSWASTCDGRMVTSALMRPPAGPITKAALRAGLLGAGAVGGYLLLSLLAGPAHADPTAGLDIGAPLGDLPQVGLAGERRLAEPVTDLAGGAIEPVAEVAEVADVAEPVVAAAEVADVAEPVVAAAEPVRDAAEPVTGVVAPAVEATVAAAADAAAGQTPLTSTVDAVLLKVVAPVADDLTDTLLTLPPSLLVPPASQPEAVAAPETVVAPAAVVAPAGPAPASPAPASSLPLARALWPVEHRPDSPAMQAIAAPAAGTGHDPPTNRPPAPPPAVPRAQYAGAGSVDPGHPWAWTEPPTAAHEPDPGSPRSAGDVACSSLAVPVSAPPG